MRNARVLIGIVAGIIGFLLPQFFPPEGLDASGARMLGIFLLAIALWITEAVPLVATAVLIILLEVLMVSSGAIFSVPDDALKPTAFYGALSDPVIILFLGGFMIALAAEKFGLDWNLAALALRPLGGHPRRSLLVLMAMTALLSMFVSNTATAATMFAVLTPVLATAPPGKTRTGLALSIPIAANVGGLATPVGSPPNAIAVAALSQEVTTVTFAEWMVFGLPLMVILLLFSWLLLSKMFIDPDAHIVFDVEPKFDTSGKAKWFYLIGAVTVVGWLTEALHGIPASTVGFFAVVALLVVGSITPNELGKLPWAVLWLVAGGIALGTGMAATGIDAWIVGLVDWDVLSPTALIAVMALLAVGLSTVISNSATANLLVPIGIALAISVNADPIAVSVTIALACSLAMAMPISTPPNAVAYATGEVTTRNMAITGLIIAAVGIPAVVLIVPAIASGVG